MLDELNAQGISDRHISIAVSCHANTIYLIRTGYTLDPRYSLGRAIEDLWQSLCGPQYIVARPIVESGLGVDAAPAAGTDTTKATNIAQDITDQRNAPAGYSSNECRG